MDVSKASDHKELVLTDSSKDEEEDYMTFNSFTKDSPMIGKTIQHVYGPVISRVKKG